MPREFKTLSTCLNSFVNVHKSKVAYKAVGEEGAYLCVHVDGMEVQCHRM